MAQEQVLEHEVLPRASRGQGAGEQQPEEFEHDLSIADLRSHEVLPPHNPCWTRLRPRSRPALVRQSGASRGRGALRSLAIYNRLV